MILFRTKVHKRSGFTKKVYRIWCQCLQALEVKNEIQDSELKDDMYDYDKYDIIINQQASFAIMLCPRNHCSGSKFLLCSSNGICTQHVAEERDTAQSQSCHPLQRWKSSRSANYGFVQSSSQN